MKRKQDYVSFGNDGEFISEEARAAQPAASPVQQAAGVGADIAYRLARIAEEAAARLPVAPNAVGVADVSEYTAASPLETSMLPGEEKGAGATRPVALVAARGKTAKHVLLAASDAGFSTCLAITQDKRFDPVIKLANATESLGDRYSEALYCNSYAVLEAAKACGASVILLAEESAPLSGVDSFLARASELGIRVFKPVDGNLALGWVLCSTDKRTSGHGAWRTCRSCKLKFDNASLAAGHFVCPACGSYMRMTSTERIDDLLDAGSFEEWDRVVAETDPLGFPGYPDKLEAQRAKTGLEEAVRTGSGRIAGLRIALGIMESTFFMGSMGSVVGEKVTRLIERATAERLPVVIFTASGGARMQEGLVSLMQMAKTSCALERHAAARLPYISVITDPTTGGVTASFAMDGDVIISEPHALIGFAGQRVIRDTIRQELPEGFQTAEFALEHGLIDAIVKREDLRETLAHLLAVHRATEPVVRAELHAPASRDIIVSYDAVVENLKNGSGTYNAVTYGDLAPEPMTRSEEQALERIKKRLTAPVSIPEGIFPRRGGKVERAIAQGGFDAEGGESLMVKGGEAAEENASAKAAEGKQGENRAWQSVQLARNVHRPTSIAYIRSFVDGFIELHGDRMFADDGAIVAGVGWIGGRAVTVIAQEKGENLKERIRRNFGCPQPEGYRKALRLMRQAEKFGRPIVCLVDTQGAFCGTEAEERGQGNAIADNLVAMAGLRVPVVTVLLGEGGSGGALALAVANRVAMQEHAVYSVLSPEGFASILWKDRTRAPEAAAVMKMSAREACDMGIVDDVVSEGAGPAHENPEAAEANVRDYIVRALDDLCERTPDELLEQRYERFRAF